MFVPANGLTLHVVDYGGEGPPLLLVHGTGMVAQVWSPVAAELQDSFRVLALDRRGHGESDKPETGYQRTDIAADIGGVIDALGIEGCAAIGHSSGGTALIVCAADRPGLLGRLVAIDPIIFLPRADSVAGNPMADRVRKRRGSWPSADEMYRALSAKFPFNGWAEDALWAYVNHGARRLADSSVTLKCTPELEARMYQHDGSLDIFAKLAALQNPLLIVRGGRTDRFPCEYAERARATAPECTLVEMPDATHFAPMERPREVALLARRFLQGDAVEE
jgi:pimeloyl-ACP methyl ester carboxylesterase